MRLMTATLECSTIFLLVTAKFIVDVTFVRNNLASLMMACTNIEDDRL